MNLSKFMKYVKVECCSYVPSGPYKKKHYCARELRQSQHQCLLVHDIPCRYFQEAVVPAIPGLAADWSAALEEIKKERARELQELQSNVPAPMVEDATISQKPRKTCECGLGFEVKSNRQQRCPRCSKRRRKQMVREAVRRHAGKSTA